MTGWCSHCNWIQMNWVMCDQSLVGSHFLCYHSSGHFFMPTHTHTEMCIHNFFFSSKSLFLPFSLKRQYKALGNGASFLLRQDFLPIVLLEENESFPQVNSNNISVRRFPAALCMPLVPAMGDALPSWIEHSRSSRTATRVLLILGEVFKYYLYVCHPFT